MSSADCIEAAFKRLKNFTQTELEDYVHKVFARAREYQDMPFRDALDKAYKEVGGEELQGFFDDATQKAKNTQLFQNMAEAIRSGKVNMRNLISRRHRNLADNIQSAQDAAHAQGDHFFFGDLTHEEVNYLSAGQKVEDLIAAAHDGMKVNDPMARKLADKIKDWWDYRQKELAISGAMRPEDMHPDRLFQTVHDPMRLVAGGKSFIKYAKDVVSKKFDFQLARERWKNYIKGRLDMVKTFGKTTAADLKTGDLDMGKVDKILDTIYDNITTGKNEIFTRSVVANDREAVERRSHMFFIFKDLRSQMDYNREYGKGSLLDVIRSDIRATANKTGIARLWGDSPIKMFNDLKHVQLDTWTTDNRKDMPKSTALWFMHTDNYLKVRMGLDSTAVSPTGAAFTANLNSLVSMVRLPLLFFQSVSDVGYHASWDQRLGLGYWRPYLNRLTHLFNLFPSEERKRLASMFKLAVDSHLGYMGRWTEANSTNAMLSKASSYYFKGILMHGFDSASKISTLHMMSKAFYQMSGKSWEALNPATRQFFSKFIDKSEWDLLRKKNQGGLFTTDNVNALSESELRAHVDATGKNVPLYEARNDLYRKVYSMFLTGAENTVLSPSDFEKVFLHWGTRPGSPTGMIMRLLALFKSYPLAWIDRVMIQGFKDSTGVMQRINWALSMAMGTVPLSLAGMYLYNVANGLSMPDWDKMKFHDKEEFLINLMAPSVAIFSGILDPSQQNSSFIFNTFFNSPSVRFLNNSLASVMALASGDTKGAAHKLRSASYYMAPLNTTPFLSPYIREIMGDHAKLQPGQHVLYGA